MKTKGRSQSKNIEDRRQSKIIGPYESNFVKDSMQRAQEVQFKKQAWNSFVKTNYK